MRTETVNISILAYLFPVGWLVAIIVREITRERSGFTTFHLQQGLGLAILEIVAYCILNVWLDNFVLEQIVFLLFIFMSYRGVSGAYHGIMRYQPFVGVWFERLFESVISSDDED